MRGGVLTTVRILEAGRERTLGPADFPLALGGPGAAVGVAGSAGPLAWLGLADGELFVQPAPGASVHCNRVRLSASHWLRDGDVLRLGSTRLEVQLRGDSVHLRVDELAEANPTEPPVVLMPPPRDERLPDEATGDPTITPIAYTPRRSASAPAPPRRIDRRVVAVTAAVVFVALVVALLARLAAVQVVVEPEPETLALRGPWPALRLGSRFVGLRGVYTLVAEKTGYRRLALPVDVAPGHVLKHALSPLPGRLAVDTPGVAGAEVAIDGATVGKTPLAAFEVEAGERELAVRADGYQEHRARIVVEGRGVQQPLSVSLVPLPTPAPTPLPPPRPGILVVTSEPPGARVILDGTYWGETPVELRLAPDRSHTLRVSKEGHDDAERTLALRAGERREETVRLSPQLGEVKVAARPPDAELLVDGEPAGRADQTLQLLAVPHEIEVRREGYEPAKQTVTPRPGFPQVLSVALKSRLDLRAERMPRVVRSPEGHELRLVEGGRIRMGASRREPGRRANEPLRDVELVRPFYVATREVSNLQFRRFEPGHTSGRVGMESLDLDNQPVVRVSWQQAAGYCNWLSDREGLPKAYAEREGKLVAVVPLPIGYRLPTEAEWERVARYPDGRVALKYPWGPALPVPPGAANYADTRARGLVAQVLEGYDDGYAVSAPVESFPANALSLLHLGGNAAEWAHDLYTVTPSVEGQLVRDPLGPAAGEYHVIRGASFLQATVSELRLSYRDYGKDARADVGFRIARYAE